jgi:multicomponent Na+:H+ antiporter subunit C
MSAAWLYLMTGVALFGLGLGGVFAHPHLLRRIVAVNISGSGLFLFLVAGADRLSGANPDPVPHAMVLTGIVVAVSATALGLALAAALRRAQGRIELSDSE